MNRTTVWIHLATDSALLSTANKPHKSTGYKVTTGISDTSLSHDISKQQGIFIKQQRMFTDAVGFGI